MNLRILTAILAITLAGCVNRKSEIVINGELTGNSILKIEYTVPVNEIFNGLMTDSIMPDSSGKFRIVIPFENPGFIILRPVYNGNPAYRTQGTIIAEPGNTYNVVFDGSKESDAFSVTGYNEEALNQYNKLPNPLFLNELEGAKSFMRDSVASSIREKIAAEKEKEIAIFKKLFDDGKISENFFKLVQTDRNCYYATVTALIMESKYSVSLRNANLKFTQDQRLFYKYTDGMGELWKESFALAEPFQDELTASPWWWGYSQQYIYFKVFMNNEITPMGLADLGRKNLSQTFHVDNGAKKYLPATILESYFANYIYRNCFLFQEFQDFELITLFDQFVSEFPNSTYTKYLTPWINKYKDYHKTVSEAKLNERIVYVDNYQNVNSIKECLAYFKGKKVYIDLWATWCGPCRMEFARAEKLREILRSKGIEILYISIDEDRYEKNWNDMIKYYNLEGSHIRANKSLYEDIRNIQNPGKSVYVPWRILFDEEGNRLAIPAEIEELLK